MLITNVEALNYRCLRYINQSLDPLEILVGPNASGKTTFLDVISFLRDLVSDGPEAAVRARTANPADLVWGRQPGTLELAVEAEIPAELSPAPERDFDRIRYEVAVSIDAGTFDATLISERVLFRKAAGSIEPQVDLFPFDLEAPAAITGCKIAGSKIVVNKIHGGNDNFYPESRTPLNQRWAHAFKLGPRRSALANLPEDESQFPVATWLKMLLRDGVQSIVLNSLLIRRASPPTSERAFKPDGSNLPWVVGSLRKTQPERFRSWLAHIRTAMPDVDDILITERADDRHAFLSIRYSNGIVVPSWTVSDGTLRLLALTVLAYIEHSPALYLIEEPENGIHPTAVSTVYQSLASVRNGQVLVATHSPVLLSIAEPAHLLCFAKTPQGATSIVSGDGHPILRDWKGAVHLSDLFVAGVLG